MASKVKPARRAIWQPGLAVAGAFALTCGIAVLMMAPSKATAKTFDTLVAAAGQVKTFQFSVDSDEHGKQSHILIAGSGGRFTIRTEEGALMQMDKGTMQIFDPTENKITRMKFGDFVDPTMIAEQVQEGMAAGFKEMNLKKTLEDYKLKYGKDHIKISPITRENGVDVYHVTMNSPNESGKVAMTIDAATDLPQVIDVHDKDSDDGSPHFSTVRMKFGTQVNAELAAATFPKNAKIVDIDLGALMSGALKGLDGNMNDLDGSMNEFGKHMKGTKGDMKGLKNLGPMIKESLKGLKGPKGEHLNIDIGSLKN